MIVAASIASVICIIILGVFIALIVRDVQIERFRKNLKPGDEVVCFIPHTPEYLNGVVLKVDHRAEIASIIDNKTLKYFEVHLRNIWKP